MPGDADLDRDFDQLDLVKMLVAGKYLTGRAATWGEGDHDAAPDPGSTFANPPVGNGAFDQLDIIVMLNVGLYMQGPYAVLQAEGDLTNVPVPEPSTLALLALGLAGILSVRWRPRT